MAFRRVVDARSTRMTHELALTDRLRRTVQEGLRRQSQQDASDFLKQSHPKLEEACDALRAGLIDRRGFLRLSAVLGVGVGAASVFASGLPGSQHGPARAEAAPSPAMGAPRTGGRIVCTMPVEAIAEPARMEWVAQGNIVRHQNEYLTFTGADNITRPMLAESWAASDDLRVWTFKLRENVRWRSGETLTAEDVHANFARWLDPEVASPNRELLAALTGREAVEVVDPFTIRLHLSWPSLSVPESLFNYPAAIMPRGFDGDLMGALASGEGVDGTGAYRLVELIPGERALLRHRRLDGDGSYWGADAPHIGPGWVDEIEYRHQESADPGIVERLTGGEANLAYEIDVDDLAQAQAAKTHIDVLTADSAQTGCMRMRLDAAPFDRPNVRKALQLACAPRAYPNRVFYGRGRVAEHHHVAPIHPDYFPLAQPRQDLAAARKLLAEAGFADGLDLTLQVGATSGSWEVRAATLMAEQAAQAGVRIALERVSAETYRRTWKSVPFGLTQWTHRPLGTMALALGYRSGAAWNETGYFNPAFDEALAHAEALIDIRARRRAMEPVQRMLQDDAPIVQPVWAPAISLVAKHVRGVEAQPSRYHHFNNAWIADA